MGPPMPEGAGLAALLPHAGRMVLLDAVEAWTPEGIRCRTRSHLDPLNPLRRHGQVSALCGVEYALQAAALHGALLAGGVAQRAGYVARLRDVVLSAAVLSGAALVIEATLERQEANGMLYGLRVSDAAGRVLVAARAGIALPAPPCA